MVQANAQQTPSVTAAVEARDLKEINRIIDHAKLARPEFTSACDKLGLSTNSATVAGKGGEPVASAPVPPVPPVVSSPPTPPTPSKSASIGSVGPPVFYLDAEGRGGTTALALATVENDADTVRRLLKEVIARCIFL